MAGREEARVFVGGLAWETTDRELASTFSRFGKVVDAQVMLERGTNRPRGFGFVTFADRRGMETAIDEMHGRELNGRTISVNRAEPKIGDDGPGYGGGGGSRGNYGGGDRGDRGPPVGRSECFKCGRSGHWARECPSGGGDDGRFSSRSRYPGGGRGGRVGGDRYNDRYADDRFDGGRYGDKDRMDSRESRYGAREPRDRYPADKYPYGGERFTGDRYGGQDRYPQNGYNKDRGYERDGPRGSDRYGGGSGGPARYEGSYRERSGPYDRPARGRAPSFEDRY